MNLLLGETGTAEMTENLQMNAAMNDTSEIGIRKHVHT